MLSGASNSEKTQLFLTEFGFSTLTIWKESFMDEPPLSPPIFNQISSGGITSLCHVSWFNLFYREFDNNYHKTC